MLKGGIFLDMENLNRCGGWNIRFDSVRALVEAQGITVLRANAYMALDEYRERTDDDYRKKKMEYRSVVRRAGFHVVLKQVQRYRNEDNEWVFKSHADVELALDAILQSDNLDYILLGTGDGDFTRLVRVLQQRGKRVDVLSFGNTSLELRNEADYNFQGFLYPDILPTYSSGSERMRGFLHMANEEKGFGFLTVQTGFGHHDQRTDIFIHITDFEHDLDNRSFAMLKTQERVVEFTLFESEDGKFQAKNARIID